MPAPTNVHPGDYHPVTGPHSAPTRHRWADPTDHDRHRASTTVTATACGARSNAVAHVLSTVLDRATYCPGCFWVPTSRSGGCTWCGAWAIVDDDNLCQDCWEDN